MTNLIKHPGANVGDKRVPDGVGLTVPKGSFRQVQKEGGQLHVVYIYIYMPMEVPSQKVLGPSKPT